MNEDLAKNLARTRHLPTLTYDEFTKALNISVDYTIEGFETERPNFSVKWENEDFEKQFNIDLKKHFNNQYEWLIIRLAYMAFSYPYSEHIPQTDKRLEKDKDKFLRPYINARIQIEELYKLQDKDGTEIIKDINHQITMLKYSFSGAFGRRIFKKEAKSILSEMPMNDDNINQVIGKFSKLRKSFL